MENDFEIPLSWYVWLLFWIIPVVLSIIFYSYNPTCAIKMLVGSGLLVIFILNKPQWVLFWLIFILTSDLIYYIVILVGNTNFIKYAIASILMKLFFLAYLLFSKNAKKYQNQKIKIN